MIRLRALTRSMLEGVLSLSRFMRVGLDQQRGYCRDELGRRERLAEGQTVGDTFRWPIGRAVTADIRPPAGSG
jgi:hypothetical protein